MNRHQGSRPRPTRSMLALATVLGTFAVGIVALLASQPAASAGSSLVLGSGNLPAISVDYGGSIEVTAATNGNYLGYAGVNVSGLGVSAAVPRGATITIGPLTTPGGDRLNWQAYCNVLGKIVKCTPPAAVYTMGVTVGAAPPPPTSDPPTSAVPTSSGPSSPGSGTTGSTPTGSAGSTGPSGPATGTGTGGSSSPGSTPSKTPSGGGGISIGPITIGHPVDGNVPLGFGPPIDPNAPTPSIPNPIGSGVGVVPTGAPSGDTPSAGQSTQTLVELANTTPKAKSRPTSLAIVAIALLAIVSSVYAYRRLGEQAERAAH